MASFFVTVACSSQSCDEEELTVDDIPITSVTVGSCGGFSGVRAHFHGMTADLTAGYSIAMNAARDYTYTHDPYSIEVSGKFQIEVSGCFNGGNGSFTASVNGLGYTGRFRSSCDNCPYVKVSSSISGGSLNIHNIPGNIDGLFEDRATDFIHEATDVGLASMLNGTFVASSSLLAETVRSTTLAMSTGAVLPTLSASDIAALLGEISEHGLYVSTDKATMTVTLVKDPSMRPEMVTYLNGIRRENSDGIDQALAAFGLTWGDIISPKTLVLNVPEPVEP